VSSEKKRFGRNLNRLRTAAGLTQEDLAEKSEISVRYLQFLEAGRYVPTVVVAGRIRKGLRCSWDELMKGID
jgi:transcriptional regulator with XRE-family HTH domain